MSIPQSFKGSYKTRLKWIIQHVVSGHCYRSCLKTQRVSLPPTAFPGSCMGFTFSTPQKSRHTRRFTKKNHQEKIQPERHLSNTILAYICLFLTPSLMLSDHMYFSQLVLFPLITCSPLPDTLFLASPLHELLPVSRNSQWKSKELLHSLCQYLILFCMKNMHPVAHNAHSHPRCVLTLKDLRAECYAEFGEGEQGS